MNAKEKMFVCSSCGGYYWPAQAQSGKCPGCSGAGEVKDCDRDASGTLHLAGK